MRLFTKFIFLTIVLTSSLHVMAIPSTEGTILPVNPREPLRNEIENYEIENAEKSMASLVHRKHQIHFGLGFWNGNFKDKSSTVSELIGNIEYAYMKDFKLGYVSHLSFSQSSTVELGLGLKIYQDEYYYNSHYSQFKVATLLDGGQGTGSLLDLQRLQFQASIGKDNFTNWNPALFYELKLGLCLNGYQIGIISGIHF